MKLFFTSQGTFSHLIAIYCASPDQQKERFIMTFPVSGSSSQHLAPSLSPTARGKRREDDEVPPPSMEETPKIRGSVPATANHPLFREIQHNKDREYVTPEDKEAIWEIDERIKMHINDKPRVKEELRELIEHFFATRSYNKQVLVAKFHECLSDFVNAQESPEQNQEDSGKPNRKEQRQRLNEAKSQLIMQLAELVDGFVLPLKRKDELAKHLKGIVNSYSVRIDAKEWYGKIYSKILSNLCAANRSAQKMAMETFESGFTAIAPEDKLLLFKMFVARLPELEWHPITERDAQRRGVRLTEKLFNEFDTAKEKAEAMLALMKSIPQLSMSAHSGIKNMAIGGVPLVLGTIAEAGLKVAGSLIQSVIPIPHISTALSYGAKQVAKAGAKKFDAPSRVRETAVHAFKRMLNHMYSNWNNVPEALQKEIIQQFDKLRETLVLAYQDSPDTADYSTLSSVFNNEYLDPKNFVRLQKEGKLSQIYYRQFKGPSQAEARSISPRRDGDSPEGAQVRNRPVVRGVPVVNPITADALPKNEIAGKLRDGIMVGSKSSFFYETNDTNRHPSALSFKSRVASERKVWIETMEYNELGVQVDLEIGAQYSRFETKNLKAACKIARAWLDGKSSEECRQMALLESKRIPTTAFPVNGHPVASTSAVRSNRHAHYEALNRAYTDLPSAGRDSTH